jgi:hypothetical protein
MKIASVGQALIGACIFVATFVCVASLALHSQDSVGQQSKESQTGIQEPDRTAKAIRVERPPKLDGTLDDTEWQAAPDF